MKTSRLAPALVLSGAAALLVEVAWGRRWTLVFGSGTGAHALVLALFMLGMGLGARGYRALARRLGGSGRYLYVRLELAAAACALAAPALAAWATRAFQAAATSWGPTASPLGAVQLGLATLVLAIPTLCMGAALPALCDELEAGAPEEVEAQVGALYAWNTLGAVLGAAVGGYLAVPLLGLRGTFWLAAALGAAAAWWLRGGPRRTPPKAPPAPPGHRGIELTYAFVGFAALALEVLLFRAMLSAAGASSYAFAAVLSAFLAGIALGAALGRRPLADLPPRTDLAVRLGLTGTAVGVVGLALPAYLEIYLNVLPRARGVLGSELAIWALATIYLLPVGLGFGALLPAAVRALLPGGADHDAGGPALARAYLANSLGAAMGALAGHYWIAPGAGIRGGILLLAGSLLLVSLGLLLTSSSRSFAAAPAGLALALAVLRPGPVHIQDAGYRYAEIPTAKRPTVSEFLRPQELLWYRDGPDTSVAITRSPDGSRTLRINGKADASSTGDMPVQVGLGLLPAFLAPDGAEALVIGLGSGATAEALLRMPRGKVDVAELSPTVLEAARFGFGEIFPRPFQDPRSRIHLVDGRRLVEAWPRRVDLIVSEPTNLFISGVANLFTREFFRAARRRLRPGGHLVQWVQNYHLSPDSLRELVRTMGAEFPHVLLTWFDDFVILASDQPIRLDVGLARERLARPELAGLARQAGLGTQPTMLVRRILADRTTLLTWAGPGPLVTDDHPTLEFASSQDRFRSDGHLLEVALRSLHALQAGQEELPLTGLTSEDPAGGTRFEAARLRLGPDLGGTASLARLAGRRPGMQVLLEGRDALLFARWLREDPAGRAEVLVYPHSALSDPGLPHTALEGGEGLHPGSVHDHRALWQLSPSGALLTWACPATRRTYAAKRSVPEGEDLEAALAELAADISCLHPDGTWGRGTLAPAP
jgi:spermidine synthase